MPDVPHASVLLVDGHPASLQALVSILEPLGQRLVEAHSGTEARQRVLQEEFALILLDGDTLGGEGLETLGLLREGGHSRSTPVLFVTSNGAPAFALKGYARGAVDCLVKPLAPELLRAKVSAFLDLHRRAGELRPSDDVLITERKRAEAALAEREERLRFILKAVGLGHWQLELATMKLEASEGCKANFGLPPESELSSYERLRSLIHPEDRGPMAEAVERAIATRSDYSVEYRVVPPGGGVRWVAARGRVVCAVDGTPLRMVGITLDITDRMRGEETLAFLSEASRLLTESMEPEDTLQRVARLAASTVATYCIVDLRQEDGHVQRVAVAHRDPELEAYLRRIPASSAEHAAPRPVAEALKQGRRALYRNVSPELRRESAVSPEHLALMERLDAHCVVLVPMQSRGRQWGVITFARAGVAEGFDERDLDMVEELARRATSALENADLLRTTREAVRLRDEFLSVASHELKTPLTPLSLKLQAMARSVKTGGLEALERRLPGDVEVMRRQVRRLSDLVDDLLDVSRISTGRLKLELEQVDLEALAREVVSRFESEAERVGCRLELGAEGCPVGHWDRLRLEQVMTNLLSNAIKYGAGTPIHIRVEGGASHVRLAVREEGIGIAPEARERIFGKFERAVSERNYGGLGLGLYITRQIVEALGGTIRVESAPGEGATFTVELPRNP